MESLQQCAVVSFRDCGEHVLPVRKCEWHLVPRTPPGLPDQVKESGITPIVIEQTRVEAAKVHVVENSCAQSEKHNEIQHCEIKENFTF